MLFCKKWPKNDPQFLLHFLIDIDVLMLCSKFELIRLQFFELLPCFKMVQNLKNHCTITHAFLKKMAKK